jgi:hypothetical protein
MFVRRSGCGILEGIPVGIYRILGDNLLDVTKLFFRAKDDILRGNSHIPSQTSEEGVPNTCKLSTRVPQKRILFCSSD